MGQGKQDSTHTRSTPGLDFRKPPNFLFMMVDEERYPPCYETPEIHFWRESYLEAQKLLRKHGLEFNRHYTGSTACSPSRATIFTGQYPSLHGVTQTTGVAKEPFEFDMFWLQPNTVPTMGHYFRAAGYQTHYKGKWHISDEDIFVPGTHNAVPSYNQKTGIPDRAKEELYLKADPLGKFGFSGWIGPEPHGSDPRKSGSSARFGVSGRDVVFASQVTGLIKKLDMEKTALPPSEFRPWLIVASFVNPHDIALFGAMSRIAPNFNFEVDDTVPYVPPAPTAYDSFETKPRCQLSYRRTYGRALQPLVDTAFYRRLYYQLQKNVDYQMLAVLDTLRKSSFYNDTIVIFTSDHGELLGAHGGLHQKWYCAYEEAIHVPLIFHNPMLFPKYRSLQMLTSHVDLLPTMLGIAGADVAQLQNILRPNHSEVHPLVGRDLSPAILGTGQAERNDEPIYFMTDDDPTRGLDQHNFTGWHYNSVIQPNHVETIVAVLKTAQGEEVWKYSRYFDNPQFWSSPGKYDNVMHEFGEQHRVWGNIKSSVCTTTRKNQPVREEYELYNLTRDPCEMINLADARYMTAETFAIQQKLAQLLQEQCRQKRLSPSSGTVPGMPSC